MGQVTFILDTSAEILATWLRANWQTPHGASEDGSGSLRGQQLRQQNFEGRAIVLTADVIWVSHKANDAGAQQSYSLPGIVFRLLPLASERVEVTAECRFYYALLRNLARLLEEMARRWPELRDTLKYLPDYWDFDSPRSETEQRLLDEFNESIRRLKAGNRQEAQPLRLEGEHPCGAIFHLDGATAREAATWLATNWQRRNGLGDWTWTPNYHMERKHQVTPMIEQPDAQGRILLTVGLLEREFSNPGALSIPRTLGGLVQENPRALEILVISAGANLTEVDARCNAVLLLKDFTSLLHNAKTTYKERLRLVQPSFGIMDNSAPPGTYPSIDEYFRVQTNEYQQLVASIEPAFAYLAPEDEMTPAASEIGPARGDGRQAARLEGLADEKTLEIAHRRQKVSELWKSRQAGTSKEQFKRKTAEQLTVSESTIRDDLRYLENRGLLK